MPSSTDLLRALCPQLRGVQVERVFTRSGVVEVVARTRADQAARCPACASPSARVHSRYQRRLADCAMGEQPVRIRLQVRRLHCDTPDCPRRTFAEQIPGLTWRYGRRTPAARRMLQSVAVALAGRAGARLAARLSVKVSRTTLLRLVMAIPDPAWTVPAVLGVDDFATRRGQHYGTVLVDCATRQVLDLVDGRNAATLSGWLLRHPGVQVICRDRASSYADGARTGAPHAVQVADRFHLWQNLGTAVEKAVRRHHRCLTPQEHVDDTKPDIRADPPAASISPIEQRLRERHATVHQLLDQGRGMREIARILHVGLNTVLRAAHAQNAEQLLTARRQPRPSQLDPYKPHLARRWAEGHKNAAQLYAELREQGYRGSYQLISDYVRPLRLARIRVAPPAPPTVRQVVGWIMNRPEQLDNEERATFDALLAPCATLAATAEHVRGFARILTTRTGGHLKDWITAVHADDLPHLHSFASSLERDWDAVVQGLTSRWNSGPVEGRVNLEVTWNHAWDWNYRPGRNYVHGSFLDLEVDGCREVAGPGPA